MKRQYRILTAVIASASVLCACQKEEQVQPEPKIENCGIIHETEFGDLSTETVSTLSFPTDSSWRMYRITTDIMWMKDNRF